MFFKFDSVTNRLAASSQMAAYSPQGISPYMGEKPPIMYSSKSVKPITPAESVVQSTVQGGRGMASAAGGSFQALVPSDPGYQRVMELQKHFCKDDGKMVWMKRGARDTVPYFATMALVAVGLGYGFYTIYQMSKPKKS